MANRLRTNMKKDAFIKKHKSWIILVLFIVLFFIWFTGTLLDLEAERAVLQMYPRDKNGVIEGGQSFVINNHHRNALVFVHGFQETPAIFLDIAHDIQNKVNADIYAPLLAFHGRDLQTASQFDNQVIMDELQHYIEQLAASYDCVTVVGLSYGGSLLTALMIKDVLPKNVKIVLYAPAIYVKTNTFTNRLLSSIFGLWRNYCNYSTLSCQYPVYDSADETFVPVINKEITLHYKVISAIKQLYALDLQNRQGFTDIHRPYSLLLAVDDNRVSYAQQKDACDKNKQYCHLYSFSSGRHMIHYGAHKTEFENLIMKLASCS